MARSLRSLLGSGLTAAPTPRSILAPSMKARACHHPSQQRQPSLTCDPVSNHALLLRVDRDHRLTRRLKFPRLGVDVLELRVAVRMLPAVLGLAIDVAAIL